MAGAFAALTTRVGEKKQKKDLTDLISALESLRLVLAVVAGVAAGLAPLTGWSGFGVLAGVVILLPSWYAMFILGVPTSGEEGELSSSELMQAGTMPALSTFLVSWMSAYSFAIGGWQATALPALDALLSGSKAAEAAAPAAEL